MGHPLTPATRARKNQKALDAGLLLDADNMGLLKSHTWYVQKSHHVRYAWTNVKKSDGKYSRHGIHRFVMGDFSGVPIDHINGDGLDNRRANLRFAHGSINHYNRHNGRKRESPMGTHFRKGKWVAVIGRHNRVIHIGVFASVEAAHKAYLAKKSEFLTRDEDQRRKQND